MQRLKIEHTTKYQYRNPVELGPHKLLIRPREGHDIRIESSRLDITPEPYVTWHRDIYGNSVGVVSFGGSTTVLRVESEVYLEHYEDAPLNFVVAEHAVTFPFQYAPDERVDLIPYQLPVFPKDSASISSWVPRFWSTGQLTQTYTILDAMNHWISGNLRYEIREEPGVQSPEQTLLRQSGSCRDLATLFIEGCRYLGLAARFVSGYLHAPGTSQPYGATHAWSEVYLPGAGWKGFDSTLGKVTGADHIAVAVSRHPETVPPIAGSYTGDPGETPQMEVQVSVKVVS